MAHLDSYGLKQCRVSEGQLHHLLNLRQLLPYSANIIVADLVQGLLLILRVQKQNISNFQVKFTFGKFQPMDPFRSRY